MSDIMPTRILFLETVNLLHLLSTSSCHYWNFAAETSITDIICGILRWTDLLNLLYLFSRLDGFAELSS